MQIHHDICRDPILVGAFPGYFEAGYPWRVQCSVVKWNGNERSPVSTKYLRLVDLEILEFKVCLPWGVNFWMRTELTSGVSFQISQRCATAAGCHQKSQGTALLQEPCPGCPEIWSAALRETNLNDGDVFSKSPQSKEKSSFLGSPWISRKGTEPQGPARSPWQDHHNYCAMIKSSLTNMENTVSLRFPSNQPMDQNHLVSFSK